MAPHLDQFDVVGSQTSGRQAITELLRMRTGVDVVVIDISMPRLNGIAMIRELRDAGCQARLLVLTSYDDAALIRQAVDAGADGYVLKTSSPAEILAAIKGVRLGTFATEPSVLQTLARSQAVTSATSSVWLTETERGVLLDIANGLSNSEIAVKRHMSVGGVKRPIADLLVKLDASNRAHLVAQAARRGLLSFEGETTE